MHDSIIAPPARKAERMQKSPGVAGMLKDASIWFLEAEIAAVLCCLCGSIEAWRCAGCFGAKAAAVKAAGVKPASGPAAGKYAAKEGAALGKIPVSMTASAAGPQGYGLSGT